MRYAIVQPHGKGGTFAVTKNGSRAASDFGTRDGAEKWIKKDRAFRVSEGKYKKKYRKKNEDFFISKIFLNK